MFDIRALKKELDDESKASVFIEHATGNLWTGHFMELLNGWALYRTDEHFDGDYTNFIIAIDSEIKTHFESLGDLCST